MLAVLSLAAGALLGEGINLEYRFEQFGSWLKKKTAAMKTTGSWKHFSPLR